MSIIFVNRFFSPDHSATSQILSDLAFHLAGEGRDVAVITSQGLYDDPAAVLPPFETRGGVAVHRVCRPRYGRASLLGRAIDYAAMYRSFAAAAWRLARPGDCFVVKTDPPLLSVALAPVVSARGALLVNWLQDLYPEVALGLGMRMLAPVAPLLTAARDKSLGTAARNVVIGERMRDRLLASGVVPERIAVIPNWCDDESISPRPAAENPLRAEWGLAGKFVVGYSGNLGRAHEYATVLGAAERLRDESDLVFLFIGGGHLLGPLRAEVERRGLSSMFQFRPYQDSSLLPVSLSAPDIHWISLLPAMEGLIVPSKFYGVAAAGRPMIAVGDPHGEIATLATRHDCGAAIAQGDDAALAELVAGLMRDPARVERWGRNARKLLDLELRRQYSLGHWDRLIESVRHYDKKDIERADL